MAKAQKAQETPELIDAKIKRSRSRVRMIVTYGAGLYLALGSLFLIVLGLSYSGITEGDGVPERVSVMFSEARDVFYATLPIATAILTYWFADRGANKGQEAAASAQAAAAGRLLRLENPDTKRLRGPEDQPDAVVVNSTFDVVVLGAGEIALTTQMEGVAIDPPNIVFEQGGSRQVKVIRRFENAEAADGATTAKIAASGQVLGQGVHETITPSLSETG